MAMAKTSAEADMLTRNSASTKSAYVRKKTPIRRQIKPMASEIAIFRPTVIDPTSSLNANAINVHPP